MIIHMTLMTTAEAETPYIIDPYVVDFLFIVCSFIYLLLEL